MRIAVSRPIAGRPGRRRRAFTEFPAACQSGKARFSATEPGFSLVYWGEERPVAETEGRCAASQEIRSWERASSGVILSRDGGRNFTLSTAVEFEDPKSSAWEPAVTELENGHLRMFLRRDRFGALFSSDSFDYGRSWSAPKGGTYPESRSKGFRLSC